MIFTIFIGILFLAVVFVHYIQGFFSATISAILAIIAAVLAFSWHETIVESLLGGKAANIAHAIVLVGLFATIYFILRIIFDKLVPEGVTVPAIVDRLGGAVMGMVAATFCTGTLAVAAQELPFGTAVAGYTKYDTADTDAQLVQGAGQSQRGSNFDELHSDAAGKFEESDRAKLFPIFPTGVDEVVVNTVYHLSGSGSLQGSHPLTDVHPDFLQELFGQRAGIQGGAQHVSMNIPGQPEKTIKIEGAFFLPRKPSTDFPDVAAEVRIVDGTLPTVRRKPPTAPLKVVKDYQVVVEQRGLNPIMERVVNAIPSSDKQMLLVIRITFGPDATEKRDLVRISPGAIRLVRGRFGKDGVPEPHDYYPIGTLEAGSPYPMLYLNKPDDYLFVPMPLTGGVRPGIDAVFVVDKDVFLTKDHKLQDGTFIEVKRLFREELGGKPVAPWALPAPGKDGTPAPVATGVLHQTKLRSIIVGKTGSYPVDPTKPPG